MHDMGALCQVSTDFAAETNPQLRRNQAPCDRAQPMGPALVCSSSHHHLHNTIYTTSSTQHHLHYIIKHNIINTHHLHYIINTTSSTQPHQHITIYITPSTQHHLHYIITYWQVKHLEHCRLTPSASFLLISLLLFFVVAASFFCFVDLLHTWMSEDIVNMWGYPVL